MMSASSIVTDGQVESCRRVSVMRTTGSGYPRGWTTCVIPPPIAQKAPAS